MATQYKSVDELVCKTSSKTFVAYWQELRRHENALRKIYAKDKDHIHVPQQIGSVNQVHPQDRVLVTFFRCAVCMKDLTEQEVLRLNGHSKKRSK
jgi:hypothetical protein